MKKTFKDVTLIQFSIANFGCFRDRVDFNMTTRKDAQNNFKLKNTDDYLLKSAVIYGPNASGKSTLLDAMNFMDLKIRKSTDPENSAKLPFDPFLMEDGFKNKPSFLEIIFSLDKKIYRYNFSIMSDHTIVEENLFEITTSEKELFSRKKQKIDIPSNFIKDEALKDRTLDKYLFLSVANQWNEIVSEGVASFFTKGFNIIDGGDLSTYIPNTAEIASKKTPFKEKVLDYLKRADFCITNFEIGKKEISKEFREFLQKNKDSETSNYIKTVIFSHPKYDKNKKKSGSVEIPARDQSDGTLNFFGGLYLIIDSLENGKILIIDELNKHLHPYLCNFIVNLFHSKKTNPHNSQLIFTTHDVTLLAEKDMDRDQFWFTERNKYGVANLFALSDFKDRKGSDFQSRYLSGRYGALPFINKSL
jgi:AAA15 family ATPase/GTPase